MKLNVKKILYTQIYWLKFKPVNCPEMNKKCPKPGKSAPILFGQDLILFEPLIWDRFVLIWGRFVIWGKYNFSLFTSTLQMQNLSWIIKSTYKPL